MTARGATIARVTLFVLRNARKARSITTHNATNPETPVERGLLVGVDWRNDGLDLQSSLEELVRLAETAGIEVVGVATQRLPHPNRAFYVGTGKLKELRDLRETLAYDVVLIDDELSPAQLRSLEDALDTKVIDRTALILDIFAGRAQTHEGRLQVELAQLEYRLPRLTRMWTHLSRQAVGGVGLRGPGETQLEADRREARRRITAIKGELEQVRRHRELYRDRRRRAGIPVVGLVGYTNAGKSTLLNTLAGTTLLAEDKLFATLDPTTRRVTLPSGREVLVTDTVGFINNLPTLVIAAFRATLEEILDATVLVHVVDITHPQAAAQAQTVLTVLEELGADDRPMITLLNKIDELPPDRSPEMIAAECGLPADALPISGATGAGLEALLGRIDLVIDEADDLEEIDLVVPYTEGRLVQLVQQKGHIDGIAYRDDGTHVHGHVPRALAARLRRFRRSPAVADRA